jgi:hypothetical protein
MQLHPEQWDGEFQAPVSAVGVVEVVEPDPFVAGEGLGALGEAGAADHHPARGIDVLDDGGKRADGVHVSSGTPFLGLDDGEVLSIGVRPSDGNVDLPVDLADAAGQVIVPGDRRLGGQIASDALGQPLEALPVRQIVLRPVSSSRRGIVAGRSSLSGVRVPGRALLSVVPTRFATDRKAPMSFRLSFHQALPGPTGAHWLDDASDVSCKDSTGQHSTDGWPLSCKQQVGDSSSPRQLPRPVSWRRWPVFSGSVVGGVGAAQRGLWVGASRGRFYPSRASAMVVAT